MSKMTVSRTLSQPERVTEAFRVRVQAAVQATGYVPNLMAGALRSNRTRLVACFVPTISAGSAFMSVVQALTAALAEHGFQLLIGELGYDAASEARLIDAAMARRPDGIVVIGLFQSVGARERLLASGIPVVEAWDLSSRPIDMQVGFSHRRVGAAAANYLIDRGCRQLAMIASTEPRGSLRAKGFVDAVRRRAGVAAGSKAPVATFTVGVPTQMHQGRAGLRSLLAAHPDIDGLFCTNDLVALGALTEARATGIAIPQRVAVIGFGNLNYAADTDPPLTTVGIDGTAIGRRTAQSLLERLSGSGPAKPVQDLGFEIVTRGSA